MEEESFHTEKSKERAVSSLRVSKAAMRERQNRLTPGSSTGNQFVAQLRKVPVLAETLDYETATNYRSKRKAILLPGALTLDLCSVWTC